MTTAVRFEVSKASPWLGAEIAGVDLTAKGLFISSSALRLTGIGEGEGKALLPFLLTHASSPNYTVGFGWRPGDFVIWDNLATWHYAVNDYDGPRAYRKVIAAQPVAAPAAR